MALEQLIAKLHGVIAEIKRLVTDDLLLNAQNKLNYLDDLVSEMARRNTFEKPTWPVPSACDWEPIATAPKDDFDTVLGFCATNPEMRTTHFDSHEGAWMKDKPYQDTKQKWEPTHWMRVRPPVAVVVSGAETAEPK